MYACDALFPKTLENFMVKSYRRKASSKEKILRVFQSMPQIEEQASISKWGPAAT